MSGEPTDAEETVAKGTVVGEYVIGDQLGIGGFGAVYRGHHPIIGKEAAIKVLRRAYSTNREVVERFVAEARSVNQIRHRNIIDIFSFGALPDGRQFFVMELLEGLTLEALIERKGRLTVDETMQILRPLVRALAAAHQHGIAHRDLKPENVFITFDDDGRPIPKLLDFGIAKLMGENAGRSKTQSGMAMGSPLYMSPEQVHGTPVDHRTDIYSLGAVVFQMLTGAPPFDGDTAMAVMIKQVTTPPPRPSSVAQALPAVLDAPILAMLAKSPSERPQTVLQAESALEEAARAAGLVQESTSGRFDSVTRHAAAASAKPGASPSFISSATVIAPSRATGTATSTSRRSTWIVGALALAGAIGFGVYSLPQLGARPAGGTSTRSEPGSVATSPTVSAVAVTPTNGPAVSSTAATSAQVASSIKLIVSTQPADAEIFQGDRSIGRSGAPIVLPYGTEEIVLEVVKPGYQHQELRVVPSADVTRDLKLSTPIGGPANTWGQKF